VLKKKQLLLNKANSEPYIENACCNDTFTVSVIEYFAQEDGNIIDFNNIVQKLTNIMADVIAYTEAGIYLSVINTKNIYPILSQEFNEKTIFLAFIYYCHFKSLLPVNEDLIPLCTSKPDFINENDSMEEIIRKLKNDGRNYSYESFLRLIQIVSRQNIINVNIDSPLISSVRKFMDVIETIESENDDIVEPSLRKLISNTLDTFNIATNDITKETRDLNNFLIKNTTSMKTDIIDYLKKNAGSSISKSVFKNCSKFITNISDWVSENFIRQEDKKISSDSLYNIVNYFKIFIQDMVITFPNIILNKVDYQNVYIPNYWGLSKRHSNDVKKMIGEYYEKLRGFYDKPSLYNILTAIQYSSRNLLLLSKETPSFSSIKYKEKELKPVFDERTSQLLFEYYLLRVFINYMDLSDDNNMIVNQVTRKEEISDIFSTDYIEEKQTRVDVDISERSQSDVILLKGNKKELKQKVTELLIAYIQIMDKHKDVVDVSYDKVVDRVFKTKEVEKDMITDRLKDLTDEERNADTILKINKLGVWSKGLQKGLTNYVKENYDEEQHFMEKMMQYENKIRKNTNVVEENVDQYMDDYIEELEVEADIEKDAYDMSNMNEDYTDGNYDLDEYSQEYLEEEYY
jgi:hypothetical protein